MTKSNRRANTTTANTQTSVPLPSGPPSLQKEPKIKTVEVGPFRLPGVKVDLEQFTETQARELAEFARESGAYVREDGLYSWKSAAKRDWFILKYS
jgi:hypothetical protein